MYDPTLTQLDDINQRIAELRIRRQALLDNYRAAISSQLDDIEIQLIALEEGRQGMLPAPTGYDLTEREQQIVACLLAGVTSGNEVARVLGISEKTVRTHLGHIYHKTGAASKTKLVILMSGAA